MGDGGQRAAKLLLKKLKAENLDYRKMSDRELLARPGVGPQTLRFLREHDPKLLQRVKYNQRKPWQQDEQETARLSRDLTGRTPDSLAEDALELRPAVSEKVLQADAYRVSLLRHVVGAGYRTKADITEDYLAAELALAGANSTWLRVKRALNSMSGVKLIARCSQDKAVVAKVASIVFWDVFGNAPYSRHEQNKPLQALNKLRNGQLWPKAAPRDVAVALYRIGYPPFRAWERSLCPVEKEIVRKYQRLLDEERLEETDEEDHGFH